MNHDSRNALSAAKVLIADRCPAVREALLARLSREAELQVCGECSTITEIVDKAVAVQPDVLIAEAVFKDGGAADLAQKIKSSGITARVLIWSMAEYDPLLRRVLHDCTSGYVSKDYGTDQVVAALRHICAGRSYFPEPTLSTTAKRLDAVGTAIEALSGRELEVFHLLGQGLDMAEIAEQIKLSVKTVETYRARIKTKLGIKGRMGLIRCAIEYNVEHRASDGASSLTF